MRELSRCSHVRAIAAGHHVGMLTGKLLALALLVVGLVAGVSVAVPALDQPDRPPSRAPLVVGGDKDRDRPDGANRSQKDDQQARDQREDRDERSERERARGDDRDDDDVSDSDDTVQVIRPRPGGGEVPDADDDDDHDDDTDDDTDDSEDGDGVD